MKQTTVYQGLFLIAFALYAHERNQAHPTFFQKEITPALAPGEIPQAAEISAMGKRLKVAPVFATPIDGISLNLAPRSIVIRIRSDELYQNSGEIAVEETWIPILDQVGNALFEAGEPKLDITFAANSNAEKDSFSVASQRADYVLRYFERKYRFRLDQGKYQIAGLGKTSDAATGKNTPMIEIILKPEGER